MIGINIIIKNANLNTMFK